MAKCKACNERGSVPCGFCEGKGKYHTGNRWAVCDHCGGTGILPCPVCGGSGII